MSASPDDVAGLSTLYGDCLAMISAVGGVFYLVFGKSLRSHIQDVYVFMFFIMILGSNLTLLYMLVTGQEVSFSRDENIGMFGWMVVTRADRLPLEVAMVVVCNFMGALGYVRAFQYFDNLVISVAALMEPVVATFIAFGLGVGMLPGPLGWIGNVLVATGTLAVVYPTVEKSGGAH
jgi:drug/metabolite transporter (DMT)-like permease